MLICTVQQFDRSVEYAFIVKIGASADRLQERVAEVIAKYKRFGGMCLVLFVFHTMVPFDCETELLRRAQQLGVVYIKPDSTGHPHKELLKLHLVQIQLQQQQFAEVARLHSQDTVAGSIEAATVAPTSEHFDISRFVDGYNPQYGEEGVLARLGAS
jgi:hypothetical protein